MKTIREVCKIVGITRKTLRGYDEIGLLSPTEKSEDGNHEWLYDNDAIGALKYIQIFIEAGYARKKIRDLLNSPSFNPVEEYKKLLEQLKKKRDRINGMIDFIELMINIGNFSERTALALSHLNNSAMYQGMSFTKVLDTSFTEESFQEDEDKEQSAVSLKLFYTLLAVGALHEKPVISKHVQGCVKDYYDLFCKICLSDSENAEEVKKVFEQLSVAETTALILYSTEEMMKESDAHEFIELQVGSEGIEFIPKAITAFGKANCTPEEDFAQMYAELKAYYKEEE